MQNYKSQEPATINMKKRKKKEKRIKERKTVKGVYSIDLRGT